ncbi:hypothetical protein [Burkholderia gladioli]|uniref:hypothetical protein n=1 Tax=Burkholderia gladioli TaxID=28095 RepID=UPI001640C35F|nr:hypothetical protein [Burkholderia gladioli]
MATLLETNPRSFYARQARYAQRRILQIKAARPEWRKSGSTLMQLAHEREERARYMRIARKH